MKVISMKTILLVLVLTLTGCTIPGKIFHSMRSSSEKEKGLRIQDMPKALVIYDEQSPGLMEALGGKVVVLARLPQQTELPQPGTSNSLIPSTLPAPAQQIIESALVLELHRKGYRSASRLNVKPILVEKAFTSGRLRQSDLGEFFKGASVLLLTVNRFQFEDNNYEYYEGVWGRNITKKIGTKVHVHLSLELLGATSSESLWTATVRLDQVFQDEPSGSALLEDIVREVVGKIPRNQ